MCYVPALKQHTMICSFCTYRYFLCTEKTILNIPQNEKHLTITSFRVHIFKDNEPSSCCLNKK